MNGKYFPRYNILLIDGKDIFAAAFECFLERIYSLSLYLKKDNDISIPSTEETKNILILCLNLAIDTAIKQARKYIKDSKVFCNIVVYFNLNYLESNLEIFNYTNKESVFKIVNNFIKHCKKRKINFFIDKIQNSIEFALAKIDIDNNPSAKIKETLNIINFNLS